MAKPQVLTLDHFNIQAPADLLEEIKDFYINVIGLQNGYRPPFQSKGYWLYASEMAILHLTLGAANPDESTGPLNHIALKCSGFAAFIQILKAREINYQLAEVSGLNQKQIFLKDPAGIGIELKFSN